MKEMFKKFKLNKSRLKSGKGEKMKKTLLLKTMILVAILLVSTMPLWANHVVVENVSITDQNAASDYTHIKFDISWENSWRVSTGPSNWDAAWVFAKWKLHSGTDWAHCTLSSTDGDHTAPSGSTIDAASDGTGIFIYRSSDGSGSNNWDNVKLRWNYGTDGVADDATVDVKVFAIEMVYIPEGSFSLYNGESGDLNSNFNSGNTISSEDAIAEGGITWSMESPGCGSQDPDNSIGGCAALGANYPKGYKAIYCMKYEISQGQYADFLSMLTDAQDDNRYPNQNGNFRHTISGSYGSYSASVPDRACNYLSWADGAAYSDWAGLRPITDLEYEKACRGPNSPVAGEYAWGDTTISGLETGSGTRYQENSGYDAASSSIDDNCHFDNSGYWNTGGGPYGPVRCGCFATGSTTRQQSGATYYGVMEMSGNLYTQIVTLGREIGRGFTGAHGDGSLDNDGNANVNAWPPNYSSPNGSGYRGGCYSDPSGPLVLTVSSRMASGDDWPGRYNMNGFRCVRTE